LIRQRFEAALDTRFPDVFAASADWRYESFSAFDRRSAASTEKNTVMTASLDAPVRESMRIPAESAHLLQ
jgi:hypothetical protein